MNRYEILNTFHSLANSQGFYGRLLRNIYSNEEWGNEFLDYLEEQNFKDTLDLILFIEG